LQDLFSIERKTISDLVGCCMGDNRDRFERELHRLRGYRFKRPLVVGSEAEILAGAYHSNIKPNAVLASVCAFEVRYDLPVVFVPTAQAGAGYLSGGRSIFLARRWRPSTTFGGLASSSEQPSDVVIRSVKIWGAWIKGRHVLGDPVADSFSFKFGIYGKESHEKPKFK
jgi:hypothetical protein